MKLMMRMEKRLIAVLMTAALAFGLFAVMPADVRAENFMFISEIRLAEGEGAADMLEEAGYHVMPAGLNSGVPAESQVYLGYKLNEGDPVTNVLLSGNGGDTLTGPDGFTYYRAGDADVDGGTGTANGYLYYTTDAKAGSPLVSLDLVTADSDEDETLYAIPNDGAEYVKGEDGSPADLELANDSVTMYLAQIRDGLVKPYISEIAVVTEADKYSAVLTAAIHGYNYYIDGDIDSDKDTYTLLACMRTADPKKAITDVIAISAETVAYLEEKQITSGTGSSGTTPKDESGLAADASKEESKKAGTATREEDVKDEAAADPGEDAAAADPGVTEAEEELPAAEEVVEAPEVGARPENIALSGEAIEASKVGARPENIAVAGEAIKASEVGARAENAAHLEAVIKASQAAAEAEDIMITEEAVGEVNVGADDGNIFIEEDAAAGLPGDAENVEEAEMAEEAAANDSGKTESAESVPVKEAAAPVESGTESAAASKLTGEAVQISGIEYIRVSSRKVAAEVPCYLYMTRDEKAGNPIAMLYGDGAGESTETLVGIWADGFFSSKGVTNAYVYAVNEDALDELRADKTVYIRYPIYLLEAKDGNLSEKRASDLKTLPAAILTSKEGLSSDRFVINGLRTPVYDPPKMERDERGLFETDLQSSAFGRSGAVVIAVGSLAIIAAIAVAAVILVRRRKLH